MKQLSYLKYFQNYSCFKCIIKVNKFKFEFINNKKNNIIVKVSIENVNKTEQ